jgi:predicted ATPase
MLTRLRLKNFRGFEDHELSFAKLPLIVGRNNAGKSTIVEALRLVALCSARYRTLAYRDAPRELRLPDNSQGISPSIRDIEFNTNNLFYRYGQPPAEITAEFSDNSTLRIYIGGDGLFFAEIRNSAGALVRSRAQANAIGLTPIHILPQVAPLAHLETRLTPEYIRRATSSLLASSHFRNQLLVFDDKFNDFKAISERNWYRLQIGDFIVDGGEFHNELSLFIRDDDFVAEVGWMGHGLQIWLQTMWFVARTGQAGSIILDEPDVYLHADLQRRLIRLLKQYDRQSIIATHSVEMISEVEPDSILIVDRKRRRSQFAPSLPAVQKVIDTIGAIHNIHLARMWSSRKMLWVEGDDMPFLKRFQDILFIHSADPIDSVPCFSIGGWGGWNYAVGSAMLLQNAGGEEILPYCILDSDYHLDDDI